VIAANRELELTRSSPRADASAVAFKSLPAQKARSPAPVTIASQRSASPAKSSKISINSAWECLSSAFIRSGRFSVTWATWPRFS
jgi:hypothetical protein